MRSYFVRITPRSTMTLDSLRDIIEQLDISKYFICYEEASSPHFHLCLWTPRSPENLRYQLKSLLDASIYISGKEIENKVKAIAYCMKDGTWIQSNIDILTLITAKAMTQPKVTFDSLIKELTEQYTDSKSDEWLASKLLDIYKSTNRKVYIAHIRSHMETIKLKKNPDYKSALINKILGYV